MYLDHVRADIEVGGLRHLVFFRQIEPHLQPEYPVGKLRHLLMQNAASRGHPLGFPFRYAAGVAQAVLMVDTPFDQIGDRFDAPVGMHGKSLQVVGRVGGVKGIQHQKWVDVVCIPVSYNSDQFHAGPVHGLPAFNYSFNLAYVHFCRSFV